MSNNLAKIVDFNLDYSNYDNLADSLELEFDDNKVIRADYIKIARASIKTFKEVKCFYDTVIDILNQIYKEHIKMVMLGTEYPIYTIYSMGGITCSLDRFSGTGNRLRTYEVKKFTTEISFPISYKCELKEMILKHRINLYMLGADKNINITGIENAEFLTSGSLKCLDYNLKRKNSNTLRLKYLTKCFPDNRKIKEVKELILENTCSIENISLEMLEHIVNIDKLTLSKSVKTIEYIELKDIISYKINVVSKTSKGGEDPNEFKQKRRQYQQHINSTSYPN